MCTVIVGFLDNHTWPREFFPLLIQKVFLLHGQWEDPWDFFLVFLHISDCFGIDGNVMKGL